MIAPTTAYTSALVASLALPCNQLQPYIATSTALLFVLQHAKTLGLMLCIVRF